MTLLPAALLGSLALLAGCSDGSDGDDFPVNPGGGDPPGGHTPGDPPDARPDADPDADPSETLRGRVCLVATIGAALQGGQCADAVPAGTVVDLGGALVEAGPDGSFELPVQPDTADLWRVGGETLYPSITPRTDDAAVAVLFVVTIESYEATAAANGVALPVSASGSIVMRLLRDNTGLPGATVEVEAALGETYYRSEQGTWQTGETGASGYVWIPATGIGVNEVTITDDAGGVSTREVPVGDLAITFANVVVP